MIYIKKILNLITKSGKKSIAVKAVNASLEKLKRKVPPSRLNLAFDRVRPFVRLYKKKVAGKLYQLPYLIKERRSIFQTAKWVTTSLELEKKGKSLSHKLIKVILKTSRRRGPVWKLRKLYLSLVKENRSYMRFIRKKRKKSKNWVFRQSFTSKSNRKEKKELNSLKKTSRFRTRITGNEKNKEVITENKKFRR